MLQNQASVVPDGNQDNNQQRQVTYSYPIIAQPQFANAPPQYIVAGQQQQQAQPQVVYHQQPAPQMVVFHQQPQQQPFQLVDSRQIDLWVITNGVSLAVNGFFLLTLSSWKEIPIMDNYGEMHTIRLNVHTLFILIAIKLAANALFVKWGVHALRTYKPILKQVEQELSGIQPAYNDSQTKIEGIKTHTKKVVKIMFGCYILLAVSLLIARCFFTEIANQFIDEEYDKHERQNSLIYTDPIYQGETNTSFIIPPVVDNDNMVIQIEPMPMPVDAPIFANMTRRDPVHPTAGVKVIAPTPAIAPSNQFLNQAASSQPFHGHGGHGRWGNFRKHHQEFDFDNWDFNKVSRNDAKLMARTFINGMAVCIFSYCSIFYAIFCGLFICGLKRSLKVYEIYTEQKAALRPQHYHHQTHVQSEPSVATGTIRAANGLGFERLPNSEPDESVSPGTYVIPRGVAIN